MKFGAVPLEQAAGAIVAHSLVDRHGRKLFARGHVLTPADVSLLAAHDYRTVTVAALGPADLNTNEAAQRLGAAFVGAGVRLQAPGFGQANLAAQAAGVLRVNTEALARINANDAGIAVTALGDRTEVQAGQMVAQASVLGLGVPSAAVARAEAIAWDSAPILALRALRA